MFKLSKGSLTSFRVSSIVYLPLCLLMLNSYTILMRYSVLLRACFLLGIMLLVSMYNYRIKISLIEQKLWLAFLIYTTIASVLLHTFTQSKPMIISLWCFSFVLFVNFNLDFYKRLIGWFNLLLFVFVMSMYLNLLIPSLMTSYLNGVVLDAAKGTILREISAHVYSGLFAEKLAAAYGACIGFVFAYSGYLRGRNRKYLLLTFFYIIAIFISGKRIATIVPILIMWITILVSKRDARTSFRATRYFWGMCIILVVGALFVPQIHSMFSKIIAVMHSDTSNDLTSNRASLLWPMAIKMFKNHWLFGNGINTYNTYISSIYSSSSSVLASWGSNGHNIYLQLLAEVGLLGSSFVFLLFGILLAHSIKLFIRLDSEDEKQMCLISIGIQLVFILIGVTENTFYVTGEILTYFAAMGIYIALIRNTRGA